MSGGIIDGNAFRSSTDDPTTQRRFTVVWGKIVVAPKFAIYKKPRTEMVVKYSGQRGYLRCVATGSNPSVEIMRRLNTGDEVLCVGTVTKSVYRTKQGEKEGWEMSCDIVIPQKVIAEAMMGDATAETAYAADEMESFTEGNADAE